MQFLVDGSIETFILVTVRNVNEFSGHRRLAHDAFVSRDANTAELGSDAHDQLI
jgi:hypothetical protein